MQRRIDRLLDEAEAAADRQEWTAVRDIAARVLAIDEESADAQAFAAMADVAADPPSSVEKRPSRGVFVGREKEMEQLRSALGKS